MIYKSLENTSFLVVAVTFVDNSFLWNLFKIQS